MPYDSEPDEEITYSDPCYDAPYEGMSYGLYRRYYGWVAKNRYIELPTLPGFEQAIARLDHYTRTEVESCQARWGRLYVTVKNLKKDKSDDAYRTACSDASSRAQSLNASTWHLMHSARGAICGEARHANCADKSRRLGEAETGMEALKKCLDAMPKEKKELYSDIAALREAYRVACKKVLWNVENGVLTQAQDALEQLPHWAHAVTISEALVAIRSNLSFTQYQLSEARMDVRALVARDERFRAPPPSWAVAMRRSRSAAPAAA